MMCGVCVFEEAGVGGGVCATPVAKATVPVAAHSQPAALTNYLSALRLPSCCRHAFSRFMLQQFQNGSMFQLPSAAFSACCLLLHLAF
ncbi:hypothetical protein OK016_23260 [Vibrio chagasii]|nr:hypothetical protein [Vibrio chagasii]